MTEQKYQPSGLSFSSSDLYHKCPQKWEFTYIKRRELVTTSVATTRGSFVHLVLEWFYQLNPDDRTAENMRFLATWIFDRGIGEFGKGPLTYNKKPVPFKNTSDFIMLYLDDEGILDFKRTSWEYLSSIWEIEKPSQIDVISTEQRFTTELAGVPFRGTIDRIQGTSAGLVVDDWKTGSPPNRFFKDSYQEKLAQIILYGAVANELYGEMPKQARLIFLNSEIITVKPTKAAIAKEAAKLADRWENIHKDIDSNQFEAKPQMLCGWCAHVDICPTGQKEVKDRWEKGKIKRHAPALITLGIIDP